MLMRGSVMPECQAFQRELGIEDLHFRNGRVYGFRHLYEDYTSQATPPSHGGMMKCLQILTVTRC